MPISEFFFPTGKVFYLNHSWLVPSGVLCAFRMFGFLYAFSIYTMTNILAASFYKNYKYLTYWGECMTLLAFFFLLVDSIDYHQSQKGGFLLNSVFSKFTLVFFELAFTFELVIVLLYWIAVFPTNTDYLNDVFYTNNVHVHGICLALMWIENILNMIEFIPSHFIIMLIVAFCYIIDNVIVTFCINFTPVYSVLTWTNGMSYGYIIACFIVLAIHFSIGYYFFKKFKSHRKPIFIANEMVEEDAITPNLYNLELEKK